MNQKTVRRIRGMEVQGVEKRVHGGEWSDVERAAVVERVLEGMAEGHTLSETVLAVSLTLDEKLSAGLVRRWIISQEEWFQRYQKTKTMLGQAFAEEAILVARESTSSTTAMDRVLIETLKWAAAKANPVEYGEKQTVEHQGAQPPVDMYQVTGDRGGVVSIPAAATAGDTPPPMPHH